MRKWVTAFAAAATMLGSGCLGAATDGTSKELIPGPTSGLETFAYDLARGFTISNNLTGCLEAGVLLFIDQSRAQALLPAGYRATDAAKTLGGNSAPMGRSLGLVTAVACGRSDLDPAGYTEAAVAIGIEPPKIPGNRPAASELYELGRATQGPGLGALLEATGWNRFGTAVEVSVAGVFGAPPGTAAGTVKDNQGVVYSFTLTTTSPAPVVPLSGTFRWWHDTPGGAAFFDYTFSTSSAPGPVSCNFRAASSAYNLTGGSSCSGAMAGGMVHRIALAQASFTYLAGVHAAT